MVCGETEITASNLRAFIDTLKEKDLESGIKWSQRHLKVSVISAVFTNNE